MSYIKLPGMTKPVVMQPITTREKKRQRREMRQQGRAWYVCGDNEKGDKLLKRARNG